MATTGVSFDLRPFEAAIHADTDIIGALYAGSLGRGDADRYADLDIELWVTDAAVSIADETLTRVVGYLGTVQFLYRRGEAMATGFVGPDWQRTDLVLHRSDDTVPSPKYAAARVIKDAGGFVGRLVAGSPRPIPDATWERARAGIEEAIDSQIYLALHNARGAVWSAMGEITYHCAELYTLLALLRGHESFGFRYVEQLLSPEELEMMRSVWPREPERKEIRRAASGLWHWTRHVWDEAEAHLGRSLDIQIDEPGLLGAVGRIYE
jgi:hypothetical protein